MITYKGYTGSFTFDEKENLFKGKVANSNYPISFQGKSIKEMKQTFYDIIEGLFHFFYGFSLKGDRIIRVCNLSFKEVFFFVEGKRSCIAFVCDHKLRDVYEPFLLIDKFKFIFSSLFLLISGRRITKRPFLSKIAYGFCFKDV